MLRYKKIGIGFVIFFITFFITSAFSRFGIDLHHQGIMYNAAKCILQGKKLYVDTYFHYGPIVAYLHSLSLLILGDKLVSIQTITVLFYSIFYFQLFLFFAKKFNLLISFFFALLWLFFSPYLVNDFLPWSSVIVLVPFTFLLYSFTYYIPTKKVVFLWGVIAAIIFFTRQSVGIPLFIIMPICLFLRVDIKQINKFYFFFGFFCIIVLVSLFMIEQGFLEAYIQSALFGQFEFVGKSVGIEATNIFSSIISIIKSLVKCYFYEHIYFEKYSLFWRLLLFFFIVTASLNLKFLFLAKSFNEFKIKLSIFILSAISLVQIFPVPDIRHYFWSFSPVIPFLITQSSVYLNRALVKQMRVELIVIKSFTIVILIYTILTLQYRIISGIKNYYDYDQKSTNHPILAGMKLNNAEKYFFDNLINFKEKIIVVESNFTPLLLLHFNEQKGANSTILISNFPFNYSTVNNFKIIEGLNGYRQKIRNNGKIAYFYSDTLFFNKH